MSGTWQPLSNQPTFGASTMLLLTDGTVMCQDGGSVNWWRLRPNVTGDYVHGTWSQLAPMHDGRLYYASAVLNDGRVFVSGGEYGGGGGSDINSTEIYDPVADSWTQISPPPGWANVGDAPCCVLPDGRLLLGSIFDTRTAIYDPQTDTWTASANKGDRSAEETWTLLPDQTVLTAQCDNHPNSEKYVIPANSWVNAGVTADVDLVESSSIEIGPALLLPDGRVFAVGATGRTALYTPPPIANQMGTWERGPDFQHDGGGQTLGAKDAPGCLLPNGNVLCVAGPVDGVSGDYLAPTYFFEFDGNSLIRVADPPNANTVPYAGRMMLLPTGQVMFAAGSPAIYVYTPSGAPDPAWKPRITSSPTTVSPLNTYTLHGRQLNGLSQAVSYGDDASSATNYPLVVLRSVRTGRVYYCRTFNHSSMGVATGSAIQSTSFAVPSGVERGDAQLCVIVNGIASDCVNVRVSDVRWRFSFFDAGILPILVGSLADGRLWVIGPNGPIPVEPYPAVAERAKESLSKLVEAVTELRSLGDELITERNKVNAQLAPAFDPELEEFAKNGKKG